jgi:hypothetical protein
VNAGSASGSHDSRATPGTTGDFIFDGLQVDRVVSAGSAGAIQTQKRVSAAKARSIGPLLEEAWLPIPGLDGYEASTWGRIRSVDRVLEYTGRWGPVKRFHPGKILRLKAKPNGCGLTYLCFYAGGGVYPAVNRTVCLTFHGHPPSERHEAAHLDGKTHNNRPENLAWKTPAENAADKVRHGTAPIGANNAHARLDETAVATIIDRYAGGEKSCDLAIEYQVAVSNIRAIVRGDTWRHVDTPQRALAKAMCRNNMLDASKRANAKRSAHAAQH